MNSSFQSVRFSAWLFLGLTLLMSFASVGVFTRMAPAIDTILEENERSLSACEAMLAAKLTDRHSAFEAALIRARSNITEPGEKDALARISWQASSLQLTAAVQELTRINRRAMERADRRAKQLGRAGAWGVVAMASAIFFLGLLFLRAQRRNLIAPLQELNSVVTARLAGDPFRRCSLPRPSREVRQLLTRMNEVLDGHGGEQP